MLKKIVKTSFKQINNQLNNQAITIKNTISLNPPDQRNKMHQKRKNQQN